MFSVGDIVQIYGPTAGHKKYHLCVCEIDGNGVCKFLFINSHDGYEGDFTLSDHEIPCLPKSPTGKSVISCSLMVKYNAAQMTLYNATKRGTIEKSVAARLRDHIPTCRALSRPEKILIDGALATLI